MMHHIIICRFPLSLPLPTKQPSAAADRRCCCCCCGSSGRRGEEKDLYPSYEESSHTSEWVEAAVAACSLPGRRAKRSNQQQDHRVAAAGHRPRAGLGTQRRRG